MKVAGLTSNFEYNYEIHASYRNFNKGYSDYSADNKLTNLPDWIIIAFFTIVSGVLAFWRQWGPEFFSDIILVTALVGVALIDIKTMLIEGRLIALAITLRLCWLLYFDPQDILNSL